MMVYRRVQNTQPHTCPAKPDNYIRHLSKSPGEGKLNSSKSKWLS
jgi:hypothetical protein